MLPRNIGRRQGLPAGSASNVTKLMAVCVASVMVVYFIWMQRSFAPSNKVKTIAQEAAALDVVATTQATSRSWTRKPGRRYVWIDVNIDGEDVGRVTAELYMDIVPKTAENFRGLVTGDNALGLTYKGSKCHRIIKGFIVQCGDFETGRGYGGKSIYGGKFADEREGLELKHSKRYILQMANSGPDTNGSQFCFMLNAAPHLNGRHVVFGEVVDGFDVVDAMEQSGVEKDGIVNNHYVVLKDGNSKRGTSNGLIYVITAAAFFLLYVLVMNIMVTPAPTNENVLSLRAEEADPNAVEDLELLPSKSPKPLRSWTRKPGRRYVWIDVEINGKPTGRVTAELYMDIVPKTAENFRGLVTGDNAKGFSYKKSKCHRILNNFIVQCGDWEKGNGTGGKSIYGGNFDDEEAGLKLQHSKRYILQMANAGPNTNGAQFCFMLSAQPHLNGHHVVFGEVVDGFAVVDAMEAAGVATDKDKLTNSVVLADGGEITN
ncbi:peptidyl-prolyl cis-trans isomerase C [Thraustotheca clavata]|uniref:Peptidyl-prolyl cis-trans isomerase C n=1 Tax=Thraustotheca clavata TaxID=74557 RepID=A0A1V9ZPV5_9STRA|nr:peptidyl-prolyl cis-trans isomerase C [Thraustotheca clavata]